MSALTAPGIRQSMEEPTIRSYPMAAVKAYQGGLAVLASGYVRPGYVATGLVAVGIFDFSGDVMEGVMDNSGGSPGDLRARVRAGIFRFANYASDLVLVTDRGSPCFIYDDNTVARTDGSAARSVAGEVVDVDSAGVWVKVGSLNGTALAAEIAAREALALDLANSSGTTLTGVLNGTQVANVANANVIGGIPVVHRIAVADGATGDVDVVFTNKTLITNIEVVKTAGAGGASDTLTVKSAANAITNAMDINVADKTVVRPTTVDDAYTTIAAGGTLRCTRTKASAANVACQVVVTGLRVA